MNTTTTARSTRLILWQATILLAFCAALHFPIIQTTFGVALTSTEATHVWAVVLVIGILLYRRREILAREATTGSWWGLVLILISLAVFAVSTVPLNIAYPRRAAVAPTMAGAILAVAGWRVFWRCLPLLLLVGIAIPVGWRAWSAIIIRPETYTLDAVRFILDMLPGVIMELDGLDLVYKRDSGVAGAIALGQEYRGASLFLSTLTLGVYVTFMRIRPWWQVVCLGLAALPVMLLCNFLRLATQGLVTIALEADPLDITPRIVATIASLVIGYLSFVVIAVILDMIVVEEPAAEAATGGGSS